MGALILSSGSRVPFDLNRDYAMVCDIVHTWATEAAMRVLRGDPPGWFQYFESSRRMVRLGPRGVCSLVDARIDREPYAAVYYPDEGWPLQPIEFTGSARYLGAPLSDEQAMAADQAWATSMTTGVRARTDLCTICAGRVGHCWHTSASYRREGRTSPRSVNPAAPPFIEYHESRVTTAADAASAPTGLELAVPASVRESDQWARHYLRTSPEAAAMREGAQHVLGRELTAAETRSLLQPHFRRWVAEDARRAREAGAAQGSDPPTLAECWGD